MPLYLTKIGPPGTLQNGVLTSGGPYYAYPNRAEYEESVEGRALSADSPLRAGRHNRGSRPNGRRIQASGVLQSPGAYPASNLQVLMEAFRAAHRAFDPERADPCWHELFIQDGGSGASVGETRIMRVSNISLTLSVKKPLNRAPWKVSYEADDPYLYAATPAGPVNLATNGSVTNVTNPGSAWCFLVLSLTLTRSSAGAVLVTNTRNGLAFSLTPDAAGIYTADGGMDSTGKAERVLRGTTDAFSMIDGEFLELEPGVNGLKVVTSGGVTAANASVTPNGSGRFDVFVDTGGISQTF